MFKMPILKTERLILKAVRVCDALDLYEYASLPEVGPMAGWEPHSSVSYSRMIIRLQRERLYRNLPCVFAIHLQENGKMIGTTEIYNIKDDFSRAELGYTISPFYQNNGYATEAAAALIDWSFRNMLIDNIICCTFPINVASLRVIEKLGFKFAKEIKNGYTRYDGSLHDLDVYTMNKDEYLRKKEHNNGM